MAKGYIYLIEANCDYDTQYKIGYSRNEDTLRKRLKAIQTGNPGKCSICEKFKSVHGRKIETTLHNIYKYNRLNGEWFDLDIIDISKFIETCEKIEQNFDILEKYDNPFLK